MRGMHAQQKAARSQSKTRLQTEMQRVGDADLPRVFRRELDRLTLVTADGMHRFALEQFLRLDETSGSLHALQTKRPYVRA
jgi:hypothetical protein